MANPGRPPIFTVFFNQCCFGALYRKPTRLLANLPMLRSWGPSDWPLIDDDDFFSNMGLVQAACPCALSISLARERHDQDFKTSSTSASPAKMDAAINSAIQHALKRVTFPSGGVVTCQVMTRTSSTSSAETSIQARANIPCAVSKQVSGLAWPSSAQVSEEGMGESDANYGMVQSRRGLLTMVGVSSLRTGGLLIAGIFPWILAVRGSRSWSRESSSVGVRRWKRVARMS